MNKLDIDYKKTTNSYLKKFNNIINNNKIEKEQIEKNFKEVIDNLEKEKNKLIDEKEKLIENHQDASDKLNKMEKELILLDEEKQNIDRQNQE